jgi:glucose/arabinose dehydrogenase
VVTKPVITGLTVPWDIAFLPGGTDWLVTERPGELRLIRNGLLVPQPVLTVSTVSRGEGGLLGIALDPMFPQNSLFYIYYSILRPNSTDDDIVNRVERFKLSADHVSATSDRIILDNIPGNVVHDGGRIKFGSDGMLYVSTGDARDVNFSRTGESPNGKILRVTSDGSVPPDNPQPGLPWFVKGLRNPQAFDWLDANTLMIADNGPTGEYLGRTGGDEVNIAQKGSDLGWPTTWHCESQQGLITPILSWIEAVPPGGLLVYSGKDIPTWKGNVLVGSTGAEHLHRIVLDADGTVASHEVYFQGELGRLRSVLQSPSGELYVTTSNCDGRGDCPSSRDGIFQVVPSS